jgi:hypothetical protein
LLNERVAACWYGSAMNFDVWMSDTNRHLFSAYFLDWDDSGRQQRVEVLDAGTGVVLDARTVSNFGNGVYLTWEIRGSVRLRVTRLAGPNAVVSAFFFDAVPAVVTPAARLVRNDHYTKGNWKSLYGAEGALVVGETPVNPAYATVTVSGKTDVIWTNSTTDVRALQKLNGTDRVAAGWFTTNSIVVDVNFTDGLTHQVALYAVDWENLNRGIVVDVLDGNNNRILKTEDLYNYNLGKYFVWEVKGHVKFRVRRYGASPSVTLSGLFFGPASAAL